MFIKRGILGRMLNQVATTVVGIKEPVFLPEVDDEEYLSMAIVADDVLPKNKPDKQSNEKSIYSYLYALEDESYKELERTINSHCLNEKLEIFSGYVLSFFESYICANDDYEEEKRCLDELDVLCHRALEFRHLENEIELFYDFVVESIYDGEYDILRICELLQDLFYIASNTPRAQTNDEEESLVQQIESRKILAEQKAERIRQIKYDFFRDHTRFKIKEYVDYLKANNVTTGSLLSTANALGRDYYLINQEEVLASTETGITPAKANLVCKEIEKEIERKRYVAVRELACVSSLPKINVPWTEWLIYSVITNHSSTIETFCSSDHLDLAYPFLCLERKYKESAAIKYAKEYVAKGVQAFVTPDNLDNLDELIEDEWIDDIDFDF